MRTRAPSIGRIAAAGRRLLADRQGVAAMEFILFSPIMLVLALGVAEVYVEHATEDQFLRYVHQAGDLLSREPKLTSASISSILSAADQMVIGFDANRSLQINVSSVGFKADNTPVLLWTRSAGGSALSPDTAGAAGMGLPADTVLRFAARMDYTSPFNFVWTSTSRSISSVAWFRPRETRAIAMDGAISEYDQNWDYIPSE